MTEAPKPAHRPPKVRKIDPKTMNDDIYYNVYEVADLLKLHHNTIRNMIKSGELKGIKMAGKWRIHRKDLIKYLDL